MFLGYLRGIRYTMVYCYTLQKIDLNRDPTIKNGDSNRHGAGKSPEKSSNSETSHVVMFAEGDRDVAEFRHHNSMLHGFQSAKKNIEKMGISIQYLDDLGSQNPSTLLNTPQK